VLVHTGWSRHFGTAQYGDGSPYLTEAAAQRLRDAGAALVGIDALNIDDVRGDARPVHSTLLRAGVLICEHLAALERLPLSGFRFYAVPVKVRRLGTFPVRAFAMTA
jgi:kynurenine formamidase